MQKPSRIASSPILLFLLTPHRSGRLTSIMKTQTIASEPHLTQADLDRVASPEEAELLNMRCHQEDCFVHGSELDNSPHEATPVISFQPINTRP